MDRKDAIAWMLSLCASCRVSQAKTPDQVAWAGRRCIRAGIGEPGRLLLAAETGIIVRHGLKRVRGFVGDPRLEPVKTMHGMVGFPDRNV